MNIRITRRILTVAVVVGALSAPVAAASTFEERYPSLGAPSDNSVVPPASVEDASTAPPDGVDTAVVAEAPAAEPSGGFDWGDATIGAAAVLAITAIAAGGVVEFGRRRRPRPKVA